MHPALCGGHPQRPPLHERAAGGGAAQAGGGGQGRARHAAGTRAISSHTGAFVGSEDVFRAVTERAGVVQVAHLEELFAAAQVFGTGRRLAGERIAIITNGGGPGVLAADRAQDLGLTLAALSEATRQTLEKALPSYWSHGNPVDIIGDAPPERYRRRPGRLSGGSGGGRGAGHLRPAGLRRADAVTASR